MVAFKDIEDYGKSVFRLFGRFPLILMVIACIGAYLLGMVMGNMEDPIGMEGLSNAFFRGVLFTVAVFYIGRIAAMNAIKNSKALLERQEEGVFIPCMSHKTLMDMSTGSIIVKRNRLYFEPTRPFGGDRTFDYESFEGFRFALSKERESIGLFLVTGEKYMLTVEDEKGNRVGTFIIPEPEVNLPILQELI